jgi:hypothetical protein
VRTAGGIHRDINPGKGGKTLRFVKRIKERKADRAACSPDTVCHLFQFSQAASAEVDVHTLTREGVGNRAANDTAAAKNDGSFVCRFHHVTSSPG